HHRIAQANLFSWSNRVIDLRFRKQHGIAETEVVAAALFNEPLVSSRDVELRTCRALEFGEPAGVIKMCLTVQQDLHGLGINAELLEVCQEWRRGFRESAIEKYDALARLDGERGHAARTHIIDVADDAERRKGLVPLLCRGGIRLRNAASDQDEGA